VQGMGDVVVYEVLSSPYFDNKIFQISHELMRVLHLPTIVLGLIGSIICWFPVKNNKRVGSAQVFNARAIALLIFYNILIHTVGAPFPRCAVPLRPFIYAMAVFALNALWVHGQRFRLTLISSSRKQNV